ncbi:CD1247 N-terminal domain-containing protein [Clostridium chauvoei]|uniref:Uncharacterized protein n=2 Tax=Clostridium chauvoei TaxID=46867 RepID=A0A1U6JE01_9CLOT|nr:CD1247 N-terminal domain-containing protein [Clostridium chauvoei]ATD55200.1 hypothetical protein BTM20_08085 [Clostridium chauvoei]ATD57128.1 hypothetical protein BTM21_04960 [Clostridium chauvoei]MBX7279544.1 hypothetical protein [Clostridium chauvoei]MBX7281913.1 hypothetical protein [Clostridium chauvoei]MBX7284498.1 hypothetical protein [Clostridium chauvoei]
MQKIKSNIQLFKGKLELIQDKEYKDLFYNISSILDSLSEKVEETLVKQEYLEENVQYMDEDLTDLQEELFEEVSFEELDDFEDEYIEINCINCNKPMFIEKESLEKNKNISCPFCKKNIK